MPQAERMDERTETRLQKAVGAVSQLVGDGMHPNDAICKIATQEQFGRGVVELLARAYNTGRTLYQFQDADTLRDKLAEFPIADVSSVIDRLYPSAVKTAAEELQSTKTAQDYNLPPSYWIEKVAREERAEKSAAILADARRKTKLAADPPKLSDAGREARELVELRKTAALKRQAIATAAYNANAAVSKLAVYFKTAGALPFNSVRQNAVLVLGTPAAKLFDHLAAEDKTLTKQASTPHRVDWSAAPYSDIRKCLDAAVAYTEAVNAAQAAEKTAADHREVVLGPFDHSDDPETTISGSVWDAASSEKVAILGINMQPAVTGGVMGGITSTMNSLNQSLEKAPEKLVNSHLNKLQDPLHEQQLREIRTKSMLADLMMNDPVISGFGEDEVLDGYSRLSELAPQAIQHRVLAQSMLRKYLEQGANLADFDLDQLVGIENKLRGLGTEHQPSRMTNKP